MLPTYSANLLLVTDIYHVSAPSRQLPTHSWRTFVLRSWQVDFLKAQLGSEQTLKAEVEAALGEVLLVFVPQ